MTDPIAMNTEDLLVELYGFAARIRGRDGEDILKMYDWLIRINDTARTLNDHALFLSIINPHDLPVSDELYAVQGSSQKPCACGKREHE